MQHSKVINIFLFLFSLVSCDQSKPTLPYIGQHTVEEKIIDGKTVFDTTYFKLPEFKFMNQDSLFVTHETFQNKVYIADFFFTSCPTVCPSTKANEYILYDHFKNDDRVKFLSHTIDTKNDTIPALKEYAKKLQIDSKVWHLVWGNWDDISSMANYYNVSAIQNPAAPGGYDHGSYIVLVDKNRHMRAFARGTDIEEVKSLIPKIEMLLDEQF